MSASAKLYLSLGINYIPQMDFATSEGENGAVTATQSFLIKKASVGVGAALINFRRGTRLEVVDPNCPALYRYLTVKETPIVDHAPGIMRVEAVFTGYAYSNNGSSGTEQTVPTYSLAGNLEEAPINEHHKWAPLDGPAKNRLGWLLDGTVMFQISDSAYGNINDESGNFEPFPTGIGSPPIWITPTGDELIFATLIAQQKVTYKKPSWTYTERSNSKTGFTQAQLATLGHIVTSPPGNPVDPGAGYTWLSVGPSQDQSGPDLFYKDLPFLLIEENDENQFLYGT